MRAALNLRRSPGAVLAAVLLAALPGAASALCPCTGAIIDHAADTNADRGRQTERLIEALRANAGQITAYLDKSVAAAEKLADAGSLNASMRSREEFRAAAEGGRYDPAASGCGGLSAAAAIAAGPAEGGDPPAATGQDTQNAGRNYERCAGDNDEVCRGIGAVADGIIADRDRYRETGGVLDPTSDLRLILQQPTIGAGSGAETAGLDAAMRRLTQNLLNPFPEPPVTEDEAETPSGRIRIAAAQAEAARRSAPAALLGWMQTISAPQLDLADWARRAAPKGYAYPVGDRISLRQYYDVAVAGSYRNPKWHERIMSASPESLAREQVIQQALANDIAWLRFDLDLRRAASEAVSAAIAAETAAR